jgi:hypothetical protein
VRQARAAALRPKLAARRNRMAMLRRTPGQHSEALAKANAVRSRSADQPASLQMHRFLLTSIAPVPWALPC